MAQWNAAFLLDRNVADPSLMAAVGTLALSPSAAPAVPSDGDAGANVASSEGGEDQSASTTGGAPHEEPPLGDETHPVLAMAESPARTVAEQQALRLFKLCSQQGNVDANLLVGDYHYYGRAGLQPDLGLAASHYHTAADMRHPQVWRNVSLLSL